MASEVKTNKISPATGTTLSVGDSGDTLALAADAVTGFNVGSDAAGDVLYNDGTDYTRLAKPGTPADEVLTFATGASAPSWAAAAAGGKILQALTFTYSTEESTTSTSLVDTSLTLSITPVSSSNKVLVLISVPVKTARNTSITSSSYAQGFAGIKRLSTNIYTSYFYLDDSSGRTGASETLLAGWSASILDSPSATIATAYTFQIATVRADYTTYSCEGARTGSIILMEVAA